MSSASKSERTRADVLTMIEKNGSTQGLDLSGEDFSGIDLSSDVLRGEMVKIGNPYDKPPPWYSSTTGGINLSGATLRRAKFKESLMWRGDFRGAEMMGVQLQRADLGVSNFCKANLREARLERAILGRAEMDEADLTGAHLEGADLRDVDLSVAASIRGIYLSSANLSNTSLRREQLENGIGEEQDGDYYQAKFAYLCLKNNFRILGQYDDASWAYMGGRRMERKTNNPIRTRRFYVKEFSRRGHPILGTGLFYVRHTTKWILDWIAEITCGYGERPLRTIFSALVVILLFPLFYSWFGGLTSVRNLPLYLIDYLQYSFAAFTTTSVPNIVPNNGIVELLTSLEALLGISALALLMFTLGKRIARS